MTLPQWQNAGQFFAYHGHKIFFFDSEYQKENQKPCLLLLHGFPTSSYDWQHLVPLFSNHFRVIFLDFLGFGFSSKPQKYPYTIKEQTNILLSLCSYLKVESAHIIAHDYSVSICTELMTQESTLNILSFTLTNSGFLYNLAKPKLVQHILKNQHLNLFTEYATFKWLYQHSLKSLINLNKETLDNYWELLCINKGHRVLPYLSNYLNERKKNHKDKWELGLKSNIKPLHILWGIDDPIAGPQIPLTIKEWQPKAQLTWLENSGHFPMLDNPQYFFEAALSFYQTIHKI